MEPKFKVGEVVNTRPARYAQEIDRRTPRTIKAIVFINSGWYYVTHDEREGESNPYLVEEELVYEFMEPPKRYYVGIERTHEGGKFVDADSPEEAVAMALDYEDTDREREQGPPVIMGVEELEY